MENIPALLLFSRRQARTSGAEHPWSLESALHYFRNQGCLDARDRVFGVIGLLESSVAGAVNVHYRVTKRALYMEVMITLLQGRNSRALLYVQSPQREISKSVLPSWVPDWTTEQDSLTSSEFVWSKFNTSGSGEYHKDFGSVRQPPNHPETIIIPGIKIGVAVQVEAFDLNINNEFSQMPSTQIRLFRYLKSSDVTDKSIDRSSTDMTLTDSSWGPPKIEIGDIIVVSKIAPVPLALRQFGDSYLFVGVCCLVDSELEGGNKARPRFAHDPGLSTIMHGSAWDETKIEDFYVD